MTGQILPVVRFELRVLRRSRALLVGIGLAAVMGVAASWIPVVALGADLSIDQALTFLVAPLELVIGLLGLLGGVGAVVGPRTGGQLKLTLGLPIERRALVIGAFVGRAVVVVAAAVVGVGAAAVTLTVNYGSVPLEALAGFTALVALFGVSLTALAIGISAASSNRGVATVAVIGAFVLFEFFWGVVPSAAHYLVDGTMPGPVVPPWYIVLERLQPFAAFETAADIFVGRSDSGVRLSAGAAESAAVDTVDLADRLSGDPPRYLATWLSLVTLLAWGIGPLWFGVARFLRADL